MAVRKRKQSGRATGPAPTDSGTQRKSDLAAVPDEHRKKVGGNSIRTQPSTSFDPGERDDDSSAQKFETQVSIETPVTSNHGGKWEVSKGTKEYVPYRQNAILDTAIVLITGNERQKREFMSALRRGEESLSLEQFNELVMKLCRMRRIREALVLTQLWEREPFASTLRSAKAVKSYTIMIDVYGKSHQLSRAFSLFYGMVRVGVRPNVITYNAMIAACARNNEPDLAYGVFDEMEANGLKPDKFTYGSLIDSCAKSGQVERAFQISKLMDANGVIKDQTIYSALMDACGRAKQLDRAFLVFEEMKRNAVWPNLVTFSVLIDTCANARQPERAFQLFSEIKHWGFSRANVVVYTALIDACSKAGWPERAELVMKDMIENGIRPNEISFGALMDGWTREGRINQAFEILDRMVLQHGVAPNAVLIGGLIDACRRLKEISHAKRIWAVVVKHSIRPSRTYYPPLIAMTAHSGDIGVASAIALHAYARGSLRRVTLNSENPTLHALACAIVYLKHVVESDTSCSETVKRQYLDRLRVVFSSTAMTPGQAKTVSPDEAYAFCTAWNGLDSKNAGLNSLSTERTGLSRRPNGYSAQSKRTKERHARRGTYVQT